MFCFVKNQRQRKNRFGIFFFCSLSFCRVADSDPHWNTLPILGAGSGSRYVVKSKFRSFTGQKWSHGGPLTLRMEAWRLIMEPWWVCRPVVTFSHQLMRSRIRIRIEVKRRIRIRIKVLRIRRWFAFLASLSKKYRRYRTRCYKSNFLWDNISLQLHFLLSSRDVPQLNYVFFSFSQPFPFCWVLF